MDTFDEPGKSTIDVSFKKYVNMNQLKMECLFDTVSLVNNKIDYLYSNLGKEKIDLTKVREINLQLIKLQKDCIEKYSILKNND